MLDPNAQTQTTEPGSEGGGEADDETLSTQAFLEDLVKMRGEVPGVVPDGDATQNAILENQFRQDTRAMIEDVKEVLREVSPDVSRGDLQKFTKAFVQGDPLEMWKVAQSAARKAAEAESNSKEQKELRVEGANSGAKGTETEPVRTASAAALRIANAFR